MEDTFSQAERVVELDSPQKVIGKPNLVLTILIFLLVFVGLAFAVGFLFGKAELNQAVVVSKEKATTKNSAGQVTFQDPKENYSIVYPESWKGTEKLGNTPGILIETEGSSVELWLRVEQPFSLSAEQKEALSAANKVKIKVGGKEIEMTEYAYKTGAFFSVAVLPVTTETTLATFWIKASDQEAYNTTKTIVQSFKFN